MPIFEIYEFHTGDFGVGPTKRLAVVECETRRIAETFARTVPGYEGVDVGGARSLGSVTELVPLPIFEESVGLRTHAKTHIERIDGEIESLRTQRAELEERLKLPPAHQRRIVE